MRPAKSGGPTFPKTRDNLLAWAGGKRAHEAGLCPWHGSAGPALGHSLLQAEGQA
jgi:hypothetical protein